MYFVPSWVRTRASPSVGAPAAEGRSTTATGSCWRPPSSRRTGSHWCRRPSSSVRRGSPSKSTRSMSSGRSSPQRSFPPSAPTPSTWASSFRRTSWRRPRTRSRPTRWDQRVLSGFRIIHYDLHFHLSVHLPGGAAWCPPMLGVHPRGAGGGQRRMQVVDGWVQWRLPLQVRECQDTGCDDNGECWQQQGGHRDRDRVQVPSAEAPGCRLRDKVQVGGRLFQMSNLNDLLTYLLFGAQNVNVNVRKRSVLIII